MSREKFLTTRLAERGTELETLRAEHERLRDVLKPFADYADPCLKVPADVIITTGSPLAKRQLTMGDCYRAAGVFKATE